MRRRRADFIAALRAARKISRVDRGGQKSLAVARGAAKDFDPLQLAQIYQPERRRSLSVLTEDRYFQGSLETLAQMARLFQVAPRFCAKIFSAIRTRCMKPARLGPTQFC
jgi:indole-3-glycerol phosphate synthase